MPERPQARAGSRERVGRSPEEGRKARPTEGIRRAANGLPEAVGGPVEARGHHDDDDDEARRFSASPSGVEALAGCGAAYRSGPAVIKGFGPSHPLVVAAEKIRPGKERGSGPFVAPTMSAGVRWRKGQSDKVQGSRDRVPKRYDRRQKARANRAAVHEDKGEHAAALDPCEGVIARRPRISHASHGINGLPSGLGRIEEAAAAHGRTEPTESTEGATAAMVDREGLREKPLRWGEEGRARWVGSTLGGRRGDPGRPASRWAKR